MLDPINPTFCKFLRYGTYSVILFHKVVVTVWSTFAGASEREIKFNSLSWMVDMEVHAIIIILAHTDKPQVTGYN